MFTDFLRLYSTGKGRDAGAEENFPSPDGLAKLKRSCDNAEHVGLYLLKSPTANTGSYITTHGPSTVPAPRNQRSSKVYTRPV